MRKFKRFINIQLPFIHFSSVLVALLFLCAEYKNPFDPKYEGSYDFSVIHENINFDSLEILKWYSITINNTEKDTFKDFTCKFSGDASSIKIDTTVDTVINVYFTNTYEGILQITGIRHNEKEITRQCTLKVENPYFIEGKPKVGIGEPVKLSIKRTGIAGDFKSIETVTWNYKGVDTTLSTSSDLTISSASPGPINVKARLNGKAGFANIAKIIDCKGYAPKIELLSFTDTSLNTISIDSFPMGVPFFMYLTVKDTDNAFVALSMRHNKAAVFSDSLIDTGIVKKMYISQEIDDTSSHEFEISVTDSDSLNDSTKLTIHPHWQPPEIEIADSIEISHNESSFIPIVKSSNRLSKAIWTVYNTLNNKVFQTDTVTGDTNGFTVNAISDTVKYLTIVVPFDKFGYTGDPDSCLIIPKVFTYRLYVNHSEYSRNDIVKFKQQYQLTCETKLKNSKITAGVSYKWFFTPPIDSIRPFISTYDIKGDRSGITLIFKDSLPKPLSIKVLGYVDDGNLKDSTQAIINTLNVRLFKPTCAVRKIADTAFINAPDPRLFIVTALDTADKSGPPGAVGIQYQLNGDSPWYSFDSSKGITFKSAGDKTVYFKAQDADSLFSERCSTSVVVISSKPFINAPDIITAISNKAVYLDTIKAQQASSGNFPIDSVYWDLDNNGTFETVTSPDKWPTYLKPDTGAFTIRVYCTDTRSEKSDTNIVKITIVSGVPKITKVELLNNVHYINTPVSIALQYRDNDNSVLTAALDTNGVQYLAKNVSATGNDTIRSTFKTAGHFNLRVRLFDQDGADTAYVSDSLIIDKGVPVINSITITPSDTLYVNDTFDISTQITENDSIKEWYFSIDSTTSAPSLSSIKKESITTSGQHIIYVRVQDNDGNFSDWKSDTVMIFSGAPEIKSIVKDDSAYIHSSVTFSLKLHDINGTLKKIGIQWKSDTTLKDFEIKNINKVSGDTVMITHAFDIKDTGNKVIYFMVWDDDNVSSVWNSCTIKILKGNPVIKNVIRKSSYSDIIFIKDSIKFTLFASDPNSVNEIRANISWNGDTIFEDTGKQLTSDSLVINHTFASNSDTAITGILFRVIDRDTLFTDHLYTITVRSGAPIIDNVEPDTVFVKDSKEYTIFAHDPDGPTAQCDSFEINFGTAWTGNRTGKFIYAFQDTNPSSIGNRSIQLRARDENLLWTTKVCTVFVDLGRPVISGSNNYGNANIQWIKGPLNTTDTMFYKWTPGQPTLVAVDTTDNDSCVSYFWNWESEDFVDENTSIPRLSVTGLRSNQVNRVTVIGTDNDNINSLPYSFYVFPDGPPTAPQLGSITIQGDSVKFVWVNSDLKDGDSTLFQIQCDENTTPGTVIKPFGTCKKSGSDFYYWFKPTVSGRYYWKVTAKDARGSTTDCPSPSFFDFVKP